MGTNSMLHGQDPGDLNSVGKPKWVPVKVTDGALHTTSGGSIATGPDGAHDFASDGAMVITLADGAEVEVILDGVGVPRSIAVKPASGDTVRIRERYAASGDWFQSDSALLAMTTDQVHSLDIPVYSIGITRTAGSGTTSKVVIK